MLRTYDFAGRQILYDAYSHNLLGTGVTTLLSGCYCTLTTLARSAPVESL